MRPPLALLARRQRGLVMRHQCFAAGYRSPELRELTRRGGPWTVVRRGVYLERSAWDTLDREERAALHDVAAHLSMETEHVMSHDSAGRAHRVPMLRPALELVHVTREGVRGGRTEAGVKHHLTQFPLPGVVTIDGLPVTSLARTGLDLAREHGVEVGVGALDHVMRQGVTRGRLRHELEVMRCWPGVTRSRRAVELADPRAENLAESLGRLLLVELGFEDVDVQWPVLVGGVVRWIDLRVGCHLVEVDGLHKYLPPEAGGFATQGARVALREERQRQAAVCGEGLGMSRVGWDDFFGRARVNTLDRLRREYDVTLARFGPTLPTHLAARAAEIRRTSPRCF